MTQLTSQLTLYPDMTPTDLLKLCYQAEFGGGHLITDPDRARVYLHEELAHTAPDDTVPLFEELGGNHARINLAPAKVAGIDEELIFKLFAASALPCGTPEGFRRRLEEALIFADKGKFRFSRRELEVCIADYDFSKLAPVGHSEAYRAAYHPAYRVIDARYIRLMPLLLKLLFKLLSVTACPTKPLVIAIDGRAASGKSTAAELLGRIFDSAVIHADDFFLPFELRTAERTAEVGGNIHYERFIDEVLPNLRGGAFTYGIFDCSRGAISGERSLPASPIRIVEGSYCLHPKFGDYADIRIFLDITPAEQKRRILTRNGEAMWQNFRERWIPMEERYFEATGIRDRVDFVL